MYPSEQSRTLNRIELFTFEQIQNEIFLISQDLPNKSCFWGRRLQTISDQKVKLHVIIPLLSAVLAKCLI